MVRCVEHAATVNAEMAMAKTRVRDCVDARMTGLLWFF
jgi:hypothetical protein